MLRPHGGSALADSFVRPRAARKSEDGYSRNAKCTVPLIVEIIGWKQNSPHPLLGYNLPAVVSDYCGARLQITVLVPLCHRVVQHLLFFFLVQHADGF